MNTDTLLTVADLSVTIGGSRVVDSVSLRIERGEVVALVGESGSGKSMTALSIMRLLPHGAHITTGAVRIDGHDLTRLEDAAMNQVRGRRIGMIFQQPQAMLDPTCRVADQVGESLRKHRGASRAEADRRAVELLREVGIAEPELRARCFAFELSGGMAQRVMMAAALAADPELLIADEPTTALDVTVQAQILGLIDEQRRRRRMGVLLITHDLTVVATLAERVAVMYAGRIVEEGPTARILEAPRHPYTRALVRCSLLQADTRGMLASIPGTIASARDLTSGCRFHPRCRAAHDHGVHAKCCAREPELKDFADGTRARCWAVEMGRA
jgi:peptide/nickel transport system ATP-binding protein